MPNKFNKLACRICGRIQDEPPWGENNDCPNFDICDCCGVEFGYQDYKLEAIHRFREEWTRNGVIWREPKVKPSDWSLEEQLKQIPEKYR